MLETQQWRKRSKNEKNQQLPAAKGHKHRGNFKKNYFLFLGGYHKLLAVIKTNSELHSVDNRVGCCFPGRGRINYAVLDCLYWLVPCCLGRPYWSREVKPDDSQGYTALELSSFKHMEFQDKKKNCSVFPASRYPFCDPVFLWLPLFILTSQKDITKKPPQTIAFISESAS